MEHSWLETGCCLTQCNAMQFQAHDSTSALSPFLPSLFFPLILHHMLCSSYPLSQSSLIFRVSFLKRREMKGKVLILVLLHLAFLSTCILILFYFLSLNLYVLSLSLIFPFSLPPSPETPNTGRLWERFVCVCVKVRKVSERTNISSKEYCVIFSLTHTKRRKNGWIEGLKFTSSFHRSMKDH